MNETKWKWNREYPVRCRIKDVAGKEVRPGVIGLTPPISVPHLEKTGIAEKVHMKMKFGGKLISIDGVKITLDTGGVIYGHQCWWEAIGDVKSAAKPEI